MNQPDKTAANGQIASPALGPAPSAAADGASVVEGAVPTAKNAGQRVSPDPTNDLSVRKFRFMTALLDKLRVNGKARAKASSDMGTAGDLLA